jgi:hypothetical protein
MVRVRVRVRKVDPEIIAKLETARDMKVRVR